MAFNIFHNRFLDLAKDSLNYVDKNQRHVTSVTVGTSPQVKEKIINLIERTLDEVQELAEQSGADANEVTQLNIQAFPIAKHDNKGSKK